MVGREVEMDADARAEIADVLELERADLNHHHIEVLAAAHGLGKRGADVARGQRALAARGEHGVDQLGRGGFAVGAGDGHNRAGAKAVGQLELAEGRQSLLTQAAHQRNVGIDAGAEHAEIERRARLDRRAKLDADAALAQGRGALEHRRLVIGVVAHGHGRALVLEEFRGFHAADSQSQDHDLFAFYFHTKHLLTSISMWPVRPWRRSGS